MKEEGKIGGCKEKEEEYRAGGGGGVSGSREKGTEVKL